MDINSQGIVDDDRCTPTRHFPLLLMIFNAGAILALASVGSVIAYPKSHTSTTTTTTTTTAAATTTTGFVALYGFVRPRLSIQDVLISDSPLKVFLFWHTVYLALFVSNDVILITPVQSRPSPCAPPNVCTPLNAYFSQVMLIIFH